MLAAQAHGQPQDRRPGPRTPCWTPTEEGTQGAVGPVQWGSQIGSCGGTAPGRPDSGSTGGLAPGSPVRPVLSSRSVDQGSAHTQALLGTARGKCSADTWHLVPSVPRSRLSGQPLSSRHLPSLSLPQPRLCKGPLLWVPPLHSMLSCLVPVPHQTGHPQHPSSPYNRLRLFLSHLCNASLSLEV